MRKEEPCVYKSCVDIVSRRIVMIIDYKKNGRYCTLAAPLKMKNMQQMKKKIYMLKGEKRGGDDF